MASFPYQISSLNEYTVIVELGDEIDELVHRRLKELATLLERRPFPSLLEVVMAFTSLTVYYDPIVLRRLFPKMKSPAQKVVAFIEQALSQIDQEPNVESKQIEIPVCYGGKWGEDLAEVAEYNGLTEEEVIEIHSGVEYLVYMVGFAPGFPYLGGMSQRIATPRRTTPRLSIPAGSVGIAGSQTGIYPLATPGGWQIIGRTPLHLFNPDRHPPSLVQAGDRIRFVPITEEAFWEWKERELG
jgi:inhibitor of KinA